MTDTMKDLSLLAFALACLCAVYCVDGCEPVYAVDVAEVEPCDTCDDVPPSGYPTRVFPYGSFKKLSSPSGGSR